MRTRRTLFILLVVFCPSTESAEGRQLTPELKQFEDEQAVRDLRQYHAWLAAYRNGDPEAIAWLLALDRKRVARVVSRATGAQDPFRPWERERFEAAALLHTDAARQLLELDDGEGAFFHLDMGSRILAKAAADMRDFASRWYFTVSRYLRELDELSIADKLLQLGRRRLPENALLLYESGTLEEISATLFSEGHGVSENVRRRRGDLNNAASWFREALTQSERLAGPRIQSDGNADFALVAGLHFGRVQTLRGEDRDALEHLGKVLGSTSDAATAYLAALFTGAAHERRGRLDAAADAYRQAISRFAAGYAAPMALSAVLQRLGHGDRSREVLLEVVSEAAGPVREPWWWYLFEPPGVAYERLTKLRSEVVR